MTLVGLCRDLLRLDTSNPGSTEEAAARYVVDALARAGVAAEVVEPQPGRCSVVARQAGRDRSLPPLVVHGHLDTVPPQSEGWTHDPFGGVEADGCLWGRGAVDMKGFVAQMLAAQLEIAEGRWQPRRDLVFAYFADEEVGGMLGSGHVALERPDLLGGAAEAVGEIGGFAVTLPNGRRVYPLQSAERGTLWVRIRIPGRAGHAAMSTGPNPVVGVGDAIGRIAALRTEAPPPEAFTRLVAALAGLLHVDADPERLLGGLGSFGAMALLGRRTTFAPTMVAAGLKQNVIPDRAELFVDCRPLPGDGQRALETLRGALDPEWELDVLGSSTGLEHPLDGPLPRACAAAVAAADPDGLVVPFVMPAGTDAQRLAAAGVRGYGFTPLVLPPGFEYGALFHAVDERVPVEALLRGYEILAALLRGY